MSVRKKFEVTELNEHDKKILDKYSKFYTNFIESTTAKNEILENQEFKSK